MKKKVQTYDKKYYTVKEHCHYTGKYKGGAHSICNLKYYISKGIPLIFHNGLNYDYPFIMKKLPKEFERKFNVLGETTEKYETFSVLITEYITDADYKHAKF